MLALILKCFAFVFACIAAAGWPQIGRVHFGWLAIAIWILAELLSGAALFR
jgi:hypothetical protein